MSADFKSLLAAAKLPERTVPICLRGDLVAEHEELERQLEHALETPTNSAEGDGSAEIAERIVQLEQEMRAHTYQFRLRAMTRPRWHAFIGEHPPRKQEDNDDEIDPRDRIRGVNVETFFPALVRESVIDPQLDDAEWRDLLGDDEETRRLLKAEGKPTYDGKLTDRQFDELANAGWSLNRGEVDVPFSPAAWRMTRGTGTE